MNIRRYIKKRPVLYVIGREDPDYKMLKRELASGRGRDIYTPQSLKIYAVTHFWPSASGSHAARSDYHILMDEADRCPECLFVLRWTRCNNIYNISGRHNVYMRKRVPDVILMTLRSFLVVKQKAK